MTPDEQLDTVLKYLDTVKVFFMMAPDIKKHTLPDTTDKDFDMLLDKLVLDGHVLQKILGNPDDILPPAGYLITFHGRQFLSRGGYHHDTIILNRKNNWTMAKTIAATLNAIIIILIAAFTAWTSWKPDEQEDKNKQDIITITNRLDKQAATIDSLQHLRTPTKPDTTK